MVDPPKQISRPEEQVLLAVHKLQKYAYSLSIKKHLEEITSKNWSLGAVYDPLDRLEKKGMLDSFVSEPTKERGGRGKRIYKLTPYGIKALVEIKKISEVMWKGVTKVSLENKH